MTTQAELEQQLQETKKAGIAYQWLARKLAGPDRYVACEANAQMLASYIDKHFDGAWSLDNLDRAYEELKSQLVHSNEPSLESAAPAGTPAQPATLSADGLPPVPPGHNWPKSKAEIKSMRPDEYRNQYHHKRTGQQFRAYINAVLQRGNLMSADKRHGLEFKKFCDQSGVVYDATNLNLMRNYIIDKYNLAKSIDTILTADYYSTVYFDLTADGTPLRGYLTHVPPPIPAAPVDRRDAFNRLADAGIRKSPGLYSHSERAKDEADRAARLAALREQALIESHRAELVQQLEAAKHTTAYIKGGPLSGQIDYAATERERAAAVEKAQAALDAFNKLNPEGN